MNRKKYKVLFRIEKYDLMHKFRHKLKNFRTYLQERGEEADMEAVFAGSVVRHFKNMEILQKEELPGGEILDRPDIRLALCHNALAGSHMEDMHFLNIRTVRAGIGEVIRLKAEGYVEYTIE